ncbi:MAG TPA: twin-arginine translocation signal domain-containing protein [Rhodocyclaceae bacterium]
MNNDKVNARRNFIKAATVGTGLALAGISGSAEAAKRTKADTCVGLVPYFEVAEGKLDEFKALGPKFVALTRNEPGCMYYGFSFSGQAAHCREGYVNAAAVQAHLKNVGTLLGEALKISKITRLEVHGPAAELEKLKGPLADLKPQYFVLAEGAFRR